MKKLIIIILMLPVIIGCSDILDTVPGDATTDAGFPDSVDDLEQMVLGTYSAYPGRSIIEASSLISDDVRIAPTNTGQGTFLYDWTYNSTTGNFEAIWDGLYISINRSNQVILNFNRITPSEDDTDLYNQIIGEAYGMRAFSHFVLLQTYSKVYDPSNLGVPYVTSVAVQQQPARNSSGEVIAAIKADIQEALNRMPSTFVDATRMNYFALKALWAKVAMWEGDYNTVITQADDILGVYSVASAAQFPGLWNDTANAGIIFEIGKDATNAGEGASGDLGGIYTRSSNGDIFFNPSDEIVSLYNFGDIRRSIYFSGSGLTAEVVKYAAADGQNGLNDIKIFRAEDILLMRAEAKVRANANVSGAQTDVNILLSNRNAGSATFGSVQSALDFIYDERRRELAYEGHRIYDSKRFGINFNRLPEDCINVIDCSLTEINRYTYPIPQSEIFANDNMEQNPGYN